MRLVRTGVYSDPANNIYTTLSQASKFGDNLYNGLSQYFGYMSISARVPFQLHARLQALR